MVPNNCGSSVGNLKELPNLCEMCASMMMMMMMMITIIIIGILFLD